MTRSFHFLTTPSTAPITSDDAATAPQIRAHITVVTLATARGCAYRLRAEAARDPTQRT